MQATRHPDRLLAASGATGFTLIELVLVIAILAVLAAVAVRSLDGIEDQSRFDSTQQGLTNIQTAIDGDRGMRQPDGRIIPNGFVADVGRLPNLIGADPATQLQELWTQPAGVSAYAIKSPPAPDNDLQIGTGWHGPYLQMTFGQPRLLDGWGDPYSLAAPAGVVAPFGVQSLGSDNAVGSSPSDVYSADLPVTPLAFPTSDYLTTVTCIVVAGSSGTSAASAKLFQPDGAGNIATVTGSLTTSNGTAICTFAGISPGSRVVRLYDGSGAVLATRYIIVPKGGLPGYVIDLSTPTTQPSN